MQLQSRLATFSTLIGVDQDHIKEFIQNNLKIDAIKGRYSQGRFLLLPRHIKESKEHYKELGHGIAKTLSEIKRYQDQRDDKSLLTQSISLKYHLKIMILKVMD